MRLRRSDTLPLLIERARTGPLMLDVVEVERGSMPVPGLGAAARTLGATVEDLAELVAAPAMRHALLVAQAGQNVPAWLTAAGTFAGLRRRGGEGGPALVVVTGPVRSPAGCRTFDDGASFGPAESALLARLRRPDVGLVGQAADAAAVECARGDPVLLQSLLSLGDAERLDPRAWCRRQAAPADPTVLPWRGAEAACPIWLAHHDGAALRRRVWRGHLGILLPWLEEVRAHLLARLAGRLPAESMDRFTGETLSPADYEWGHLAHAMRRWPGAPTPAAEVMRRVRNALAHGDPATWQDTCRLEQAREQLFAFR